jgi:hypothetical protein
MNWGLGARACWLLVGVRQKVLHADLTAQHGMQARVIIRKCPCRHLRQRNGSLSLQTDWPAQVMLSLWHKQKEYMHG